MTNSSFPCARPCSASSSDDRVGGIQKYPVFCSAAMMVRSYLEYSVNNTPAANARI